MRSRSTSTTLSLSIGVSLALLYLTSFKGEWRPSLEVVARSKGYNTYETLASLTFWGITHDISGLALRASRRLLNRESKGGGTEDWSALPHSIRPALFTNLYNRCHRDSQLYYIINKETGDDLAPDIGRCGKSCCEKRKNHQKTTIVREASHRKTPWFWQTDHNYRYLGAYRWNERNTNSKHNIVIDLRL